MITSRIFAGRVVRLLHGFLASSGSTILSNASSLSGDIRGYLHLYELNKKINQ